MSLEGNGIGTKGFRWTRKIEFGREKDSIGMTLYETATLMKDFGCIWAMNLDGGGSSVMLVKGEIANSPNIKGGIAISNALVITES